MQVLLVDDDALILKVISTILRKAGYEVVCATGGQEALERIAGEPPACVLLDFYMDDVAGLDVLVEIRQRFSKEACPVVMISSEEDEMSIGVALEFGANDFLNKPVKADVLLAKMAELFPRAAQVQQGDRLGRYSVDRVLEQSEETTTYLAHDVRLGRQVWIKAGPSAEYEANVLALLNHPQILTVHDVGLEPVTYMVTELVEGAPLATRSVPARLSEALRWTREILQGVGALHALDLVHTCLDPTTVFLKHAGQICCTDFAAALSLGSRPLHGMRRSSSRATAYTAPELRECALGSASPSADVFSVAGILHFLLTGAPPGPDVKLLESLLPRLVETLGKGLSPNPGERFQSAAEFSDSLRPHLMRDSRGA